MTNNLRQASVHLAAVCILFSAVHGNLHTVILLTNVYETCPRGWDNISLRQCFVVHCCCTPRVELILTECSSRAEGCYYGTLFEILLICSQFIELTRDGYLYSVRLAITILAHDGDNYDSDMNTAI